MGCCSSTSDTGPNEPSFEPGSPLIQPMTILVTGKPGSGVTSICHRFVHKEFPDDAQKATIATGGREVAVNGNNVLVTLVDCNDKRAMKQHQGKYDAVMYAIDAGTTTEGSPFDGIFKRIERLYLARDKRKAFMLQHSISGGGSFTDGGGSTSSVSDVPNVAVHVSDMRNVELAPMFKNARSEFGIVQASMNGGAGGAGAGAAMSSQTNGSNDDGAQSSFREPVGTLRLSRPNLEVRTDKSPKVPNSEVNQPLQDTIPPLHVVLTRADELVKSGDRYRIRRVRAMASNWSMANRCSVSFVSSLTGQGMEEAFSSMIRDIVWRRHAEVEASQGRL